MTGQTPRRGERARRRILGRAAVQKAQGIPCDGLPNRLVYPMHLDKNGRRSAVEWPERPETSASDEAQNRFSESIQRNHSRNRFAESIPRPLFRCDPANFDKGNRRTSRFVEGLRWSPETCESQKKQNAASGLAWCAVVASRCGYRVLRALIVALPRRRPCSERSPQACKTGRFIPRGGKPLADATDSRAALLRWPRR